MSVIMIIGVLPESLINFRGELIRELASRGHAVHACAGFASNATLKKIEDLGASFRSFNVSRAGMNPLADLRTLLELRSLLRKVRPDVIMTYTIKPTIWGGIALRSIRSKARLVCLITGIGMTMENAPTGWRRLLRRLVRTLYRSALTRSTLAVFQNQDDLRTFVEAGLISKPRCRIVDGSGVNLERFRQQRFPAAPPFIFLTVARLLRAKGLRELAHAAAEVKRWRPDIVVRLVGPRDSSPDRIPDSELDDWIKNSIIEYGGESTDVANELRQCLVFVLPSYHEGIPRTVIEAMATGRAIITTDAPGCRETVVDGHNGYLIPVHDHITLAHRMIQLAGDKPLCEKMGIHSRRIAEDRFDVKLVNKEMLKLIEGDV